MGTLTRLTATGALSLMLAVAAAMLPPASISHAASPHSEQLAVARSLAAEAAAKLEAATTERDAVERAIAHTEAEVELLGARADELRGRARQRAAKLYIGMGSSWLDAVVGAPRAIDAGRAMHLTAVAGDHDRSVLAELRAVAQDLDTRRGELRARHAKLDEVVASLAAARAVFEARVEQAVLAHRRAARAATGGVATGRSQFVADATWLAFKECTLAIESGGNYRIVSPDGRYYGAWQFAIPTWNAVAGRMGRHDLVGVLPSEASPEDQDAVAHALWLESGNRPWGGRC